MKVLIVGGFLGSGKTSFILKLARHMVEDLGVERIAILENEIGEVGVDDKVLKGAGLQVKNLFSGCVCCTLAGELPSSIRQIEREIDPEWIIMEATGVAFPASVKENLERVLDLKCRIITLADAKRWKHLYLPMKNLFRCQMQDADIVIISKEDLVDHDTLNEVSEMVRTLNGDAELMTACVNESFSMAHIDAMLAKE